MFTSAASAVVCADAPAESAIPVVIEVRVLAVNVLATAALSKSALAMPPSAGNAAPAKRCVPGARFTTAPYPLPPAPDQVCPCPPPAGHLVAPYRTRPR